MQTLTHGGATIDYKEIVANLENKFELKLMGVDVEVKEHYEENSIELIVGENSLFMTLEQTCDLLRVITRAVNKVGRSYRKQKFGKS